MIYRIRPAVVILLLATSSAFCAPANTSFKAPDSLVLKDGRTIRGLIIKNSVDSVTIQQEYGEETYKKTDITRIRDEADIGVAYTDIFRKGDLPPWRVIANDLRTRDGIKSLVEIPATTIDNGVFKNIPYISFRANEHVELNIYGNPNKPAGIEMGLYGGLSGNDKLRKILRSYLAGFLTSRAEIAALYAISFDGGIQTAGDITIEITPKSAPDAYGAWWISLYNRKSLDSVRMRPADYDRLTRRPSEVIDKNGRVIASGWSKDDLKKSKHVGRLGDNAHVILRGFYRDDKGDFQVLTQNKPTP